MGASLLLATGIATATVGACGSSDDSGTATAPIPSSAFAGFTINANAFSFPNFAAGYADAVMSPALVVRMFGKDGVCADSAVPCTLTPAANAWVNNVNASMDGGRCEGFAVLSSVLFLGLTSSTQFGAPSTRQLVLDGNIPLQEELAYWYATQNATVVTAATKQLYAKDALAFLATFLQTGTTEYYRIGFARKTSHGLAGGHAVTPVGYESVAGQPGVYILHVYDNNFPDQDRVMTLDTNANRWEYHASTNPSESSADYYGDMTNQNPLYFAPIKPREGTLPCPFCAGATRSQTVASGSAQVTSTDGAGNSAGIAADGSTTQTGAGTVTPGFSEIDTWDGTTSTTLTLPAGDTTLSLAGTANGAAGSHVLQLGGGYMVDISNLTIPSGLTDSVTIGSGGSQVVYTNKSGTAVTLATAVLRTGGGSLQVTVTAPAGASSVTASITQATGTLKISANGTAGQMVTISVTKVASTGTQQSGSITTTGTAAGSITIDADTWMPGQPLTGQQDNGMGTTTTVGDLCGDGKKDGNETDTDCGGACSTKCADGKACAVAADCTSGTCDATIKVCEAMTTPVVDPCTDGTKDGSETDTDCGGSCTTKCATGKGCVADTDCTTSACDATTNVCDADPCTDGRKDGSEADTDCGGTCATKCATGKACTAGADCATTLCTGDVCETLARKVFITSQTYAANFGGLTVADGDCQALATTAHLPGTYKAFLSDQTTSAEARLATSTQPYVLVDGTEVADNATDFYSDGHMAKLDLSESGATIDTAVAWTGSLNSGGTDGSQKCASWTSATLDDAPTVGQSDLTDGRWAQEGTLTCGNTAHFYCIEQ